MTKSVTVTAAELVATMTKMKADSGSIPESGEFLIAADLPRVGQTLYVVDPVILCSGKSFIRFKIERIGTTFNTNGMSSDLATNAVIFRATAYSRTAMDIFYNGRVEFTFAPGRDPKIQILRSASRAGLTRAFLREFDARSYVDNLANTVRLAALRDAA